VCFEVETGTQIVEDSKPCNWGMRYYCVIGFGRAHFVNEFKDKKDALDFILKKYSSQSSFEYSEADLEGVAL